jgi:TPP-dependent pyruvate/acetoin dehydrogenase alpha subunit
LTEAKILSEAEIAKINAEVRAQIDQAVAVMQAAQSLRPESALDDVYAN